LDPGWPSRTLEVLNKADLMGGAANVPVREGCIPVSAITGDGLPDLLRAIDARLSAGMEMADYHLPSSDGARIAWLYEHGEVLDRRDDDSGIYVQVRMLPADRARFERES
jgi:GTPase